MLQKGFEPEIHKILPALKSSDAPVAPFRYPIKHNTLLEIEDRTHLMKLPSVQLPVKMRALQFRM